MGTGLKTKENDNNNDNNNNNKRIDTRMLRNRSPYAVSA